MKKHKNKNQQTNSKLHTTKKKPSIVYWLGNNLYLNITNSCPNSCYFCFRKYKNGIQDFNLKLENEPSAKEVIEELQKVINKKNWNEVVFCGFGEPLERLDLILEVTKYVKKHYWKTVRVDTNGQGYLLNKGRDVVLELKKAGVNKVNVSLNAHNKETYNQICKPTFEDAFEHVLEFIKKAKKEGLETEATSVTIPEVELTKIRELAESIGVNFRVREYISFIW
ncbi:MAG: TatD family nuclease-associated radical SAM protein [Candidatus Bathyarchaeota archaeon]|nr:TatD family nuclease-associated radical SAM protein [Candidatus Bathyarchaeum sp.]